MFVNEPWIIDQSFFCETKDDLTREPDKEEDNIRIYVPVDLNERAILRRLDYIIARNVEANEKNEPDFSYDVNRLLYQVEIYDLIWRERHASAEYEKHSAEAKRLVAKFVETLEAIPDGCAEMFPFALIEGLREEYRADTL